jgi:Flp pilus assembly protein TadB
MAEQDTPTPFIPEGAYPAQEPDLTPRQSGWLLLSIVAAVLLTLVSVFLWVTWPLAVLAWFVAAALVLADAVGKKLARRRAERHPEMLPPPPPPPRREPDPARFETP